MTKLFTRLIMGVAAFLCIAGIASAAQYPPGPGGAFPDTLKIENLQNSAAVPFPATADTVYGISGIITGFDAKATGYAFYIQSSTGAKFTGIDIFTGSFNKNAAPWSLALGDSVVCYGKKQEFQGETELEGYDNAQGTDDCIVRRVSSGNALPAFTVLSSTQARETPTNTTMEEYEGMLVRVNQSGAGTMKVARTVGLSTNSFILVDSAAPSDSIFIDGNTLATYPAPAVNSVINRVQGIVNQRTRGYRIQLRDGNDIVTNTPPNVTDAYPVADDQIRVTFDRDVTTATATDINNYSLASFGTVDAAVMDGQSAAIITVTNGLPHGAPETVTVSGIAGFVNNVAMTSGQSRTFINGVLTCAEIQAPNPDSLAGTPCLDKSRFAGAFGQTNQGNLGTRCTVKGVSIAKYTTLDYLADAAGGARSGLVAFGSPIPIVVGRQYMLVGQVQEFFGETEFSSIVKAYDLGAASGPGAVTPLLGSIDHDGCDATQTLDDAEDYEGMLVKVNYGKVILAEGLVTPPTTGFHISNIAGTDTIFVSNLNGVLNPFVHPTMGTTVQVTGVLHYANNSFRICPRNYSDIVDLGVGAGVGNNSPKVHFSVVQNPSARPRLAFGLPQASDVELGVYDVTGRQIVTLEKGHLPAGEYSRAWDGRSAAGSKVGPGVYFYRLTVNGQTFSTRSIKLQ
ncbi:MAG: T9SS type A sorting domain-containing protein [Candidatus Eisenbacteria bacterium]|uniref:T9SS type A sorting domain-containing protein n=1 Tax=Eiseniibacteriota bacterium TaxID=2212470 RepID=A0A933SEJ9_UNCEI|nr:T9SS type A sorting domain-containing protein [Candidatus Eisenbacteria bacterium]